MGLTGLQACIDMEATPKKVRIYITIDRKRPFKEWLKSLKDIKAVTKIERRLERLEKGNEGDVRSVGNGVSELRIDYGPGYRVYFGQLGAKIVLLLCGGDKSTQAQDLKKAQEYWSDYRRREDANK